MTRRYGQHFLTDPAIIGRIVDAADIGPDDGVLEIGPGRGILTRALAARARTVVSAEIDRRLHAMLVEEGLPQNVELLRADALSVDPATLAEKLGDEWKLVSNLPYQITTATLERFLPLRARTGQGPVSLTLMLQKEVGERILAKEGDMNRLALFCGYFSEPRMAFTVPRGAFSPPPKVDSCVMRFLIRSVPPLDGEDENRFFRLTTAAFAEKRKKIRHAVVSVLGESAAKRLAAAGLTGDERPEEISREEWMTIARGM